MTILLDSQYEALNAFAAIVQVPLTIINLFFAGFLIWNQIKRERLDRDDKLIAETKSTRLQWFKELIIQPNINNFLSLFISLEHTWAKLKSSSLTIEQKITINEEAKLHFYDLKSKMVDLIISANKKLHTEFITELDKLLDHVSTVIFESTTDLSDDNLYTKNISEPIENARLKLMALIFSYDGK